MMGTHKLFERIARGSVLGDGALGTMLYARGVYLFPPLGKHELIAEVLPAL